LAVSYKMKHRSPLGPSNYTNRYLPERKGNIDPYKDLSACL